MTDKPYALVTGGASGIGRAIVERLADDGFHIVIVDLNAALADEVVAALTGAGHSAETRSIDITDETAVGALVAALPRLDVLVNNAGLFRDKPFETTGQPISAAPTR